MEQILGRVQDDRSYKKIAAKSGTTKAIKTNRTFSTFKTKRSIFYEEKYIKVLTS